MSRKNTASSHVGSSASAQQGAGAGMSRPSNELAARLIGETHRLLQDKKEKRDDDELRKELYEAASAESRPPSNVHLANTACLEAAQVDQMVRAFNNSRWKSSSAGDAERRFNFVPVSVEEPNRRVLRSTAHKESEFDVFKRVIQLDSLIEILVRKSTTLLTEEKASRAIFTALVCQIYGSASNQNESDFLAATYRSSPPSKNSGDPAGQSRGNNGKLAKKRRRILQHDPPEDDTPSPEPTGLADPNPFRDKVLSREYLSEVLGVDTKTLYELESALNDAFEQEFVTDGDETEDETMIPFRPRMENKGHGRDGLEEIGHQYIAGKPGGGDNGFKVISKAARFDGCAVPAMIAIALKPTGPNGTTGPEGAVDWGFVRGAVSNERMQRHLIVDRWFTMHKSARKLQEGTRSGRDFLTGAWKRSFCTATDSEGEDNKVRMADLLEHGLEVGEYRLIQLDYDLVLVVKRLTDPDKREHLEAKASSKPGKVVYILTNAWRLPEFDDESHGEQDNLSDEIMQEQPVEEPVRRSARNERASPKLVSIFQRMSLETLQYLGRRLSITGDTKTNLVAEITNWNPTDVEKMQQESREKAKGKKAGEIPAAAPSPKPARELDGAAQAPKQPFKPQIFHDFVKATDEQVEGWIKTATLLQMRSFFKIPGSKHSYVNFGASPDHAGAVKIFKLAILAARGKEQVFQKRDQLLGKGLVAEPGLDPYNYFRKNYNKVDLFNRLLPAVRFKFRTGTREERVLLAYLSMGLVNSWIAIQIGLAQRGAVYELESHKHSLVDFGKNVIQEWSEHLDNTPTGKFSKRT